MKEMDQVVVCKPRDNIVVQCRNQFFVLELVQKYVVYASRILWNSISFPIRSHLFFDVCRRRVQNQAIFFPV